MTGRCAPGSDGVSARESDVLAGLQEHQTNAEIAAHLFISVRTVESHVSSLLRKFQVEDRRALANVAPPASATRRRTVATLPSPLTTFIGRAAERAELGAALVDHRLVTAVGPGGIGKTRLALSVADEVTDRFADGSWLVDLVPVVDPGMVAVAINDAIGIAEQQGQSADQTLIGWLAPRQALLVLDNCEHLLDTVVVLLERVLAGAPGLRVLATSRARLLVPFERVFPVPGLSVAEDGGDAVDLFLGRAALAPGSVTDDTRRRIAAVCRGLDGMALAIELAAARFPSLGLDGLESGLADRLALLTGGSRLDDRHRSLRSALDWSYALLSPLEQAVLRRVAVFAAPFTAAAAVAVLGDWAPVPSAALAGALAGLSEQSLLMPSTAADGTRYRALETIRQYGDEQLVASGEALGARQRHRTWCLEVATTLAGPIEDRERWRSAFDRVADELRGALTWAVEEPTTRAEAFSLALVLGQLCFTRGLLGEAQRRYTQAAELAPDPAAAVAALRSAAGAAETRHFGSHAMRLRRAAADAAVQAGDRAGAAGDLAQLAELINRGPGLMPTAPEPGAVEVLIAEARALAGDDLRARARIMSAEAFNGALLDPRTADIVDEGLALARRIGDPLVESAVLDQLTAVELAGGRLRAAVASTRRRTELLAAIPVTAAVGLEFFDAFSMAADCAIAAGDLAAARTMAEHVRDLPFHREESHLGTARLLVVTTLAGDWDEAVGLADRYRQAWERAGRPRAGNLSRGAYAAATVHGLRGEDDLRAQWLEVVDALATPGRPISAIHFGEFFDALLLLHRGEVDATLELLTTPPEEFLEWHNGMWRPWYAALWAEAAALAGHPDAGERAERAGRLTIDNPIAAAIVERATALRTDRAGLLPAAAAFARAGCRYQWARTLVLAGGEHSVRGESELVAMGARPMVVTVAPP